MQSKYHLSREGIYSPSMASADPVIYLGSLGDPGEVSEGHAGWGFKRLTYLYSATGSPFFFLFSPTRH